MSDIHVTGCIFSTCDQPPHWLIDGVLRVAGGAYQQRIDLPVCEEHVQWFGYRRDRSIDGGWQRESNYPVQIESEIGRMPRKLLVQELGVREWHDRG